MDPDCFTSRDRCWTRVPGKLHKNYNFQKYNPERSREKSKACFPEVNERRTILHSFLCCLCVIWIYLDEEQTVKKTYPDLLKKHLLNNFPKWKSLQWTQKFTLFEHRNSLYLKGLSISLNLTLNGKLRMSIIFIFRVIFWQSTIYKVNKVIVIFNISCPDSTILLQLSKKTPIKMRLHVQIATKHCMHSSQNHFF